MKKFKKENKSKGNKVLRAREGDFLTDVSDVSDVSEDYSKYLNPLYPAFSVLRATGKALHKYSPQSKRTSFEEQAFKNAMGKMVQGIKVPKDGLKKTADAVVSVSPPIAPSTITPQSKKVASGVPPVAPKLSGYSEHDEMITPSPVASSPSPVASSPASVDRNVMEQYRNATPSSMKDLPAMKDLSAFLKKAAKAPDAPPELAKAAEEIPKTKSGMKKFMDEYGKFIALGAMAGTGGKAGRIAAPIIAALPGLIEMMKKKKSGSSAASSPAPSTPGSMAHGGSMKKSSGGEPPKKSEGGAIRKFKGGSMKGNTMDSTLTPKYAKGGDMPKGMSKGKMGKAAGEMPQHKKMAMGKPTPQSMGQKFAKGGAAKYASGGMCKGYGIAKKIRPTGPMN